MWWSTTTLFIKPKRLTSGSRSIPDLSCCGCRRIVPEPIRLNGPLGMCTTSAPAIISASAYAIWSRMSSIICRLMGPGTIKSLGFTMSPKSPSRSTVWSLSNSHESPPECTNLVWSGLDKRLANLEKAAETQRRQTTGIQSEDLRHDDLVALLYKLVPVQDGERVGKILRGELKVIHPPRYGRDLQNLSLEE